MSTSKQDLTRQIDALAKAGIDPANIYVDKKSGTTTERPGLQALLECARGGDVIVVHTLDRLGRTVRDTLNLIHDLHQRDIGFRNLADPVRIDSTNPDDPMGQLAVVLLALFGQMERTYAVERAAHARTVATEKGRRCSRCGDGPLLTGSSSDDPPRPVLAWLERHEWTTTPELVCGNHNTRRRLDIEPRKR